MVSQTLHLKTPPSEDRHASDQDEARRHLLTVNVEDYFQVGVFQKFISADNWYRFEPRLRQNIDNVLQLLDRYDTKATFFVLGWTAEKEPELVRSLVNAGHEVASRGFLHQPLLTLPKEQIRADLRKSKQTLEDVTGQEVAGFRLSDGWLKKESLWLLDEIAGAGYRYDSSLMPRQRDFDTEQKWRRIQEIQTNNGPLLEIPLSTMQTPGGWLPISGGNYQRQLPNFLMRRLVDRAVETDSDPFVMYFQVWELDTEQPRLSVADRLTQMRHYRKLDKYKRILPQYLERYQFTSIREHAELTDSPLQSLAGEFDQYVREDSPTESEVSTTTVDIADSLTAVSTADSAATKSHVTIVIPCYNEESSLPYLANTLSSVVAALSKNYVTNVLFVDDCSTDNTRDVIEKLFGEDPSINVVRHEVNRGVSAAILTGMAASKTEIVCSMDCDCSYDPHELVNMLPLLTADVSMVTASPYHRDGLVKNVPGWRLLLSRGLSAIYQKLLKQELATWTSCFRVYRRSQILDLPLQEDGFLGTAELSAQLILNQRPIAEHPATLEVRLFGLSKMKTVKAILSHLRLLAKIAASRFFGSSQQSKTLNEAHSHFKGTPVMNMQLPSDQDSTGRTLGQEELELLRQVIESGTLTSTKGNFVKQLETEFAKKLGGKYAYACSSGTAAIHCAIAAINPEPGDEIITTSITDMGGLTPIIFQGAIPVFCDVDPITYNVTAKSIGKVISEKTKAIIVTHLFGNPCDMAPIMELAKKHNIPVIEDCAQAFLSTYREDYVGTIGDIGCFSLQQGKHITTGEGGIVVTNNEALARHMFLYINKAWGYGDEKPDHYFAALNYRMTELQGAVAVAQLGKLNDVVASRTRLADSLTTKLSGLPGISTPTITPDSTHTYWKYCLNVDASVIEGGSPAFGASLREQGIACAPRYIQKPAFECQVIRDQVTFGTSRWPFTLARPEAVDYSRKNYEGTYAALEHVLVIAFNECYTDEHVEFIANAVRDAALRLQKTGTHSNA